MHVTPSPQQGWFAGVISVIWSLMYVKISRKKYIGLHLGVSLLDAWFSYVVFVSLYFLSCTWVGLFGVSLGYLGVTRGYAEPTWGFWRLFGIQYFGRITHCSLFPAFDSGLVGLVLGKGRYLLGGYMVQQADFQEQGRAMNMAASVVWQKCHLWSTSHSSLLTHQSLVTTRCSLLTHKSRGEQWKWLHL